MKRKDCVIETLKTNKTVHLLELQGTLPDIHLAQGYLMSEEIENGAINEMLENFNKFKRKLGKYDWAFDALLGCYVGRLERSVTPEVREAIKSLHEGYAKRYSDLGKKNRWSYEDIRLGTYGIEIGNILYGQLHTFEKSPLKTILDVTASCGGKVSQAAIRRIFNAMIGTSHSDKKMGCVGMVMPGKFTTDGHLIHGRNLDQTPLMETWAKAPVMYTIHETNHIPYVAVGTAGLIFPGGISGFNQSGISVSLHQMNTDRFVSKHKKNSAALMPFLQQKILRQAHSIDEAVNIIHSIKSFSSWSILISDAKTGEAASFELSAHKKVVARRSTNKPMSQSNHFLSPDMQREHFHSNYSSYIETESRLLQMAKELESAKGKADLTWAMNTMAGHIDFFEGERSFGRTAVKASNIMTSIAIAGKNEMWMTIGDKKPAAHSHYLGIQADFENNVITPIGIKKNNAFESRPHFEKSFALYVEAYYAHTQSDRKLAITKLQEAIKMAQIDEVDDLTYQYNLSRLLMLEKRFEEARPLMENMVKRILEFHPYQQVLVTMFHQKLRDHLGFKDAKRVENYELVKEKLLKLKKDFPFKHGAPNIDDKIKMISKWQENSEELIPGLDFAVLD